MRVQCLFTIAAVALLLSITACAGSLASMSAGDVNCPASQISVSNEHSGNYERTWNATCRGQVFDCSVQTPVLSANADARCVPTRSHVAGQYPAARTQTTRDDAEVKRGYDEGRSAHFVTGKFGVAQGLHVIVSGAPKVSMGTISVMLSGHTTNSDVRLCESLEVLINGEPVRTDRNVRETNVGKVKIESRFDFPVFQPLAGRFPVFGVRACGTTWAFTPHQLEQLRALFVVYSDLAKAAQGDPDAAPTTTPGQTAL